jgi:hypothetical protein
LFLVFSGLKVTSFSGKTKEKMQVERSEIPLRGASSLKPQAASRESEGRRAGSQEPEAEVGSSKPEARGKVLRATNNKQQTVEPLKHSPPAGGSKIRQSLCEGYGHCIRNLFGFFQT